ncbi:MAG: hypothetical protein AAGC71_09275 [Pseudomonadota bacterium]
MNQIRVRPQYHFRRTTDGVDAWFVARLIDLAADLPVQQIDPRAVVELDEDHWYSVGDMTPTPRSVIEHASLIRSCDLSYPIILDAAGRVMDGMHRVCKAVMDDVASIPAKRFIADPAPDYVNCDPATLPYDR